MTLATARLLVGRKIVGFELHPFSDGRGGTAHRPLITLDNGARLGFDTEETDVGEYGVCPTYYSARSKPRKARP